MLGRLRMEPGGKRKLSVLPTPFCCEPKATLKSHRFLKEKKIITTTNVPWNCFFPKMVSVILPEGKEHVLNNFFNFIFLYQNHGTRASLTGLREGPGAGPPALDAPTREPFPRRLHPPPRPPGKACFSAAGTRVLHRVVLPKLATAEAIPALERQRKQSLRG